MADRSYIVIILKKDVADKAAAQQIVDAVKTKMADRPDIDVKAQFTNHFNFPE